jgi:biopolymer transport protein ExbD
MKFPVHARLLTGRLDAAPFLSLLAVVFLFLLVHTMIVFTPGVKVDLPVDGAWPGVTGPSLSVALDAAGQLFFENQMMPEEKLRERFAAAVADSPADLTLIIQADGGVDFERVVRLSGIARAAGIPDVVLATRANAFAPQAGR